MTTSPESQHPTLVVGLDPATGAQFALASGSGGGAAADREFRIMRYVAIAGNAPNYSTGDIILRSDVFDVTGASPTLIATDWFNASTGASISAPTQSQLGGGETTVSNLFNSVGGPNDGKATSGTGTWNVIQLLKGIFDKLLSSVGITEVQASAVAWASVAATGTIGTLLTASAGRRRFIATNPSASTAKIGLSVKSDATLAQCEIILSAGESWVESLAAASQWYVITETGSISVPVQTAS